MPLVGRVSSAFSVIRGAKACSKRSAASRSKALVVAAPSSRCCPPHHCAASTCTLSVVAFTLTVCPLSPCGGLPFFWYCLLFPPFGLFRCFPVHDPVYFSLRSLVAVAHGGFLYFLFWPLLFFRDPRCFAMLAGGSSFPPVLRVRNLRMWNRRVLLSQLSLPGYRPCASVCLRLKQECWHS